MAPPVCPPTPPFPDKLCPFIESFVEDDARMQTLCRALRSILLRCVPPPGTLGFRKHSSFIYSSEIFFDGIGGTRRCENPDAAGQKLVKWFE